MVKKDGGLCFLTQSVENFDLTVFSDLKKQQLLPNITTYVLDLGLCMLKKE